MRPPATIRADGVDWPLATFIDAYRLLPVDRFIRPDLLGHQRLTVLDDAGQISSPIDADQVDWCRTIAWRTLDAADAPEIERDAARAAVHEALRRYGAR